jgi:hypothetical protein
MHTASQIGYILVVIPGKLAKLTQPGIQEIQRTMDCRLRGNDE